MGFPVNLNTPRYAFTIPSSKEKVSMRPFLVGEQKSMMLALATEDTDTIVDSIKQILTVCSDGKLDANILAGFDLEYLFLQLRAKSIGETMLLSAPCRHCSTEFRFQLDITTAKVEIPDGINNKFQLSDSVGVVMRWPTVNQIFKIYAIAEIEETDLYDVVVDCIDSVWNSDDVIKASDYPRESREEFVNSLTVMQMKQLVDFIKLCPTVKAEMDALCPSCKKTNHVVVEGIENFFG